MLTSRSMCRKNVVQVLGVTGHRTRWEVRPWNTPTGRAPEAAGSVVKGLAEASRDHREKRNPALLQECEKWKVSTYQPEEKAQ